jgi:hypothetical protein
MTIYTVSASEITGSSIVLMMTVESSLSWLLLIDVTFIEIFSLIE